MHMKTRGSFNESTQDGAPQVLSRDATVDRSSAPTVGIPTP